MCCALVRMTRRGARGLRSAYRTGVPSVRVRILICLGGWKEESRGAGCVPRETQSSVNARELTWRTQLAEAAFGVESGWPAGRVRAEGRTRRVVGRCSPIGLNDDSGMPAGTCGGRAGMEMRTDGAVGRSGWREFMEEVGMKGRNAPGCHAGRVQWVFHVEHLSDTGRATESRRELPKYLLYGGV